MLRNKKRKKKVGQKRKTLERANIHIKPKKLLVSEKRKVVRKSIKNCKKVFFIIPST